MMRFRRLAACTAILVFGATLALAQNDPFDARLKKLEEELRCLVCQNQTLADSTAPLAQDLRREVRELALSGKDDAQIKEYLVARYGDFVLYNPPVKSTTWLLWFGPFALLAGGGLVWLMVLRRRRGAVASEDDDDAPAPGIPPGDGAARAREMLAEEQQEK
jgi:cytochrome c-type biogenesis protein CcmH